MLKIGVITMALMSFLHAGWLGNLLGFTPTPPIRLPIDLSKAGSIAETKVTVKEKGTYYFSFVFLYTDEVKDGIRDAKRAKKIAGYNAYEPVSGKQTRHYPLYLAKEDSQGLVDDNYNLDGTIIPIKLIFSKMEKDGTKIMIKDEIYQTKGSYSLTREFEKFRLEPGRYSIKIENLEGILEMENRKADFRFARHGTK